MFEIAHAHKRLTCICISYIHLEQHFHEECVIHANPGIHPLMEYQHWNTPTIFLNNPPPVSGDVEYNSCVSSYIPPSAERGINENRAGLTHVQRTALCLYFLLVLVVLTGLSLMPQPGQVDLPLARGSYDLLSLDFGNTVFRTADY